MIDWRREDTVMLICIVLLCVTMILMQGTQL